MGAKGLRSACGREPCGTGFALWSLFGARGTARVGPRGSGGAVYEVKITSPTVQDPAFGGNRGELGSKLGAVYTIWRRMVKPRAQRVLGAVLRRVFGGVGGLLGLMAEPESSARHRAGAEGSSRSSPAALAAVGAEARIDTGEELQVLLPGLDRGFRRGFLERCTEQRPAPLEVLGGSWQRGRSSALALSARGEGGAGSGGRIRSAPRWGPALSGGPFGPLKATSKKRSTSKRRLRPRIPSCLY